MRTGIAVLIAGLAVMAPNLAVAQQTAEQLRNEAFVLISGGTPDRAKAIGLFNQAAEAGDAASMAYLGGLYLSGDGVEANRQTAIEWYLKAAQAGHPGAAARLAELAAGNSESPANVPVPIRAPDAAPSPGPDKTVAAGESLAPKSIDMAKAIWDENDPLRDYEAVLLFHAAADQGDTEAYYYLGQAHADARGATPDDQLALEWYGKAIASGDARGLIGSGEVYWIGRQVEVDRVRAIDFYERAAQAGNAKARGRLAAIYTFALNGTRDIDKAISYYQQNVDAGDVNSLNSIAGVYSLVVKDYDKALEYHLKALAAGASDAEYELGAYYRYSFGDLENREANMLKGMDFLERAAAKGDSNARNMLGELHLSGEAPWASFEKGMALLEASAEAGDASAMIAIGEYYGAEYEDTYNPEKAATWYRRAIAEGGFWAISQLGALQDTGAIATPADDGVVAINQSNKTLGEAILHQAEINARPGDDASLRRALGDYLHAAHLGNPDAMLQVGIAYQYARGVNANFDEAIGWYRRATDAGSLDGMVMLADAFVSGSGVPQDLVTSTGWLRRAAEAGHPRAMSRYADALINGWGVDKDLEAGIAWLRKGVAEGDPQSFTLLGRALFRGDGLEVDIPQAATNIYRGLKMGDSLAQTYMADPAGLPKSFWTEIQKLLTADGFYSSRIDGAYGPGTRLALEEAFGSRPTYP